MGDEKSVKSRRRRSTKAEMEAKKAEMEAKKAEKKAKKAGNDTKKVEKQKANVQAQECEVPTLEPPRSMPKLLNSVVAMQEVAFRLLEEVEIHRNDATLLRFYKRTCKHIMRIPTFFLASG